MKLSQIRPCDNCGKKIAPLFYVLRVSQAMFLARQTNEVLGMTQFLGALALAEIMSPDAEAVKVFGDANKELMAEIFICQPCVMEEPLDLAMLLEKVNAPKENNANHPPAAG